MKRPGSKQLLPLIALLLGSPFGAAALTCPAGTHQVCHSGSGRGGGYHTTCSCVVNPPPACVTSFGSNVASGVSATLYDVLSASSPDTCTVHGFATTCSNGAFDPPPPAAYGYVVCNNIVTAPADDDEDGDGIPEEVDNCPDQYNPDQEDADLDSIGDACDRCPGFATPDNRDSDGNGIGDACECGDQNGDGTVNVLDVVGINLVVFGAAPAGPLCDTNDDGRCDVSDMIGANQKAFGAPAYCLQYPMADEP